MVTFGILFCINQNSKIIPKIRSSGPHICVTMCSRSTEICAWNTIFYFLNSHTRIIWQTFVIILNSVMCYLPVWLVIIPAALTHNEQMYMSILTYRSNSYLCRRRFDCNIHSLILVIFCFCFFNSAPLLLSLFFSLTRFFFFSYFLQMMIDWFNG